ncbi:25647_t:CDS:2, partial [Racocetra persica]
QRIPVTHNENDSVIHIMGRAHIAPPYVVSSVECDNEIILERRNCAHKRECSGQIGGTEE